VIACCLQARLNLIRASCDRNGGIADRVPQQLIYSHGIDSAFGQAAAPRTVELSHEFFYACLLLALFWVAFGVDGCKYFDSSQSPKHYQPLA